MYLCHPHKLQRALAFASTTAGGKNLKLRSIVQVISYAYKYLAGPETDLPDQQFCHLLNVTQCDVTESSDTFVVNVYNPLARTVDKFVRLPVVTSGNSFWKFLSVAT